MLDRLNRKLMRWTAALVLVGAVHGAAVSYALRSPPEDDFESQAGGAFIIELSPITASPAEEARDVALGQKSEDVAAVAASAPQIASVATPQAEDQPPVPEIAEKPPEDALPKRPDEKPPKETKPPEATAAKAEDAPAVAPVDASEAAAPQKIENATETAETTKGKHAGTTQIDRAAIENWQRDLVMHINKHKRYPAHAREARQQGVATIAFALERGGRVVRAAIVKSTGVAALDDAAIEMLNRASPLPAAPASMPGSTLDFVVPIRFRWKE